MWKPISGYEGLYSVSDRGRVRSEERRVQSGVGTRRVRERIVRVLQHPVGNICKSRCGATIGGGNLGLARLFGALFLDEFDGWLNVGGRREAGRNRH